MRRRREAGEKRMEYAMFESGGKQYVARPGETVEVDHLPLNAGVKTEFNEVLLVSDGSTVSVGRPFVEGAKVEAKVVGHIRAPKVIVFKYIPKERYRRKQGHRQQYTKVEIQEIVIPGRQAARASKEAEAGAPVEEKPTRTRKAATKSKTTKKTSSKGVKTTSKSVSKKSTAKKSTRKKSGDEE
jgi:large subunit ribosomal protein L21